MNYMNIIVFICFSMAIFRVGRSQTMPIPTTPDWTFYERGCTVSTAAEPNNYANLQVAAHHLGAQPKCTTDYIGIQENYCVNSLRAETNDYDLSKPDQGIGYPTPYGQLTCDRLKAKDVKTTLVLTVTFGCIGPHDERPEYSYDALKDVNKTIDVNCVNGKFVP